MNEQQGIFSANILDILSLILGIQNLYENRSQSAHNDVQAANDKQAHYLLDEIKTLFDEQNKVLERQNQILDRLDRALKNMGW